MVAAGRVDADPAHHRPDPVDPRADFNGSGTVDFADFLSFVSVFGKADATFDLDGSNQVDFGDFLIFVQSFGKSLN